ncbi:MAG: hypothetical protein ABIQ88_21600 [Chitinophagaceae bacterium]
MKTQSTNFFPALTTAQMAGLTTEVKETLALDVNHNKPRILSIADVWNIQRIKRTRVQRRFSL